ncbi:MAG TPA: glycosyltransferase [Azospirillum sp.]|nr:glycosyltransferase [Azospirillum sp.]
MLEPVWEREGDAPPDLSVIMPVRNTAALVGEAVSSVLDQRGCAAEIVISDDHSDDGTLDAVLRVVRGDRGPHTVRVVRPVRRLAIDHVDALARAATCRLLVQAHGDDVSLPDRLTTLLDVHRTTGAALVTSAATLLTASGIADEPVPFIAESGWLPLETVIRTNPGGALAGARYALDRSVFERFPPLTSAYLPIGHDVLQAFRAALLGGVWLCAAPLIRWRQHDGQWTHALWDTRLPAANDFGFLLNRLGAMRAMGKDLDHAAATGLLPDDRVAAVRAVVNTAASRAFNDLLRLREDLRRLGREPLWVTVEEMARANTTGSVTGAGGTE